MLSLLAALSLQAAASASGPPAPPPPPPPVRESGTPAQAKAHLATLISSDDYPSEALRHGEQGTVGHTVDVGTDGLVKKCTISSSSGSAALNSATCRVLTERARFTPARNERGKPIADTVSARFIWRIDQSDPPAPPPPLPEKLLEPFEPNVLVVTMGATPDGTPICTAQRNGLQLAHRPCPQDTLGHMAATARASGRRFEHIAVIITTPKGEREPVDDADRGPSLLETAMTLSIAPDGSVLECRTISIDNAVAPSLSDGCFSYPRGKRMFELASEANAAGPREALIKFRVYIRN